MSANEVARHFYVVADAHQFDGLRRANRQPLCTKLDKEQASLRVTTLGPKFNDPVYWPAKVMLKGLIVDSDVRGSDPNRYFRPREPSRLKTHYRAIWSAYTVVLTIYKQSLQNEPVLNEHVHEDHRLRHFHCSLHGNKALDFVLHTIPTAAQLELELPGSSDVGAPGRGQRKRAQVAEA